jgi:hypothetical protein
VDCFYDVACLACLLIRVRRGGRMLAIRVRGKGKHPEDIRLFLVHDKVGRAAILDNKNCRAVLYPSLSLR